MHNITPDNQGDIIDSITGKKLSDLSEDEYFASPEAKESAAIVNAKLKLPKPMPPPPMPTMNFLEVKQWLLVFPALLDADNKPVTDPNGKIIQSEHPVWILTVRAQDGTIADIPKHPMIVCLQCGIKFERGKSNQRFCSKRCGSNNWKHEHRKRIGQGTGPKGLSKSKQQTLNGLIAED